VQGGTDALGHLLAVEVPEILGDLGFTLEHSDTVGLVGVVKDAYLGVLGVKAQGRFDVALFVRPAQGSDDFLLGSFIDQHGELFSRHSHPLPTAVFPEIPSTRSGE